MNLFAIADHFVSYRWVIGPHNFFVIVWNLLKTKKIVCQQKQTTNERNKNPECLNASWAAQNSGCMFVTSDLERYMSSKQVSWLAQSVFLSTVVT